MSDERLSRALGLRLRRDMLHLLFSGKASVHHIAKSLDISEVNASKHLKKLFDMGLLKTHTAGRERFYELKIAEVKSLITQYDLVVKKMGGKY